MPKPGDVNPTRGIRSETTWDSLVVVDGLSSICELPVAAILRQVAGRFPLFDRVKSLCHRGDHSFANASRVEWGHELVDPAF